MTARESPSSEIMKIQLHIENLRVEGTGPMARTEMAALIQEELQRLIEAYGLPPGLSEGGALVLGHHTIHVTPGSSRAETGVQIARGLMGEWFTTGPGGPSVAAGRMPAGRAEE